MITKNVIKTAFISFNSTESSIISFNEISGAINGWLPLPTNLVFVETNAMFVWTDDLALSNSPILQIIVFLE